MRIGIHHSKNSFSERWIDYCDRNNINYKIVDCYQSDIIEQLADCDALMWHFNHKSPKASKFAKQLLFSLQTAGKKVFPDFNTTWHFDDKVGQKYLLEAIGAPLAPSYIFYDRKEAIQWAYATTYPKVFKLRNGAGSDNVRLVNSEQSAKRLINKAFRHGFKQYEGWNNLKERIRKYKNGKTDLRNVMKGVLRLFKPTEYARVTGKEIGYAYFQDFIPGNNCDIRVIVIGNKAFAIKRMVRENDFRASGSGFILYEKEHFEDATIRLAFDVSEKLGAQCMAYDFVYLSGKPLIVEISYGFAMEGYDACTGYWDKDLQWYPGKISPQSWMVDLMLQ
jgi:glutathione synthase/RimK-type ligase-like ATP-grasp enzyme